MQLTEIPFINWKLYMNGGTVSPHDRAQHLRMEGDLMFTCNMT